MQHAFRYLLRDPVVDSDSQQMNARYQATLQQHLDGILPAVQEQVMRNALSDSMRFGSAGGVDVKH